MREPRASDGVPRVEIAWRVFRPDRPDVRLVGVCGEHLAHILFPHPGVREVYVSEGTVQHYSGRHGADLDMEVAEELLAGLFADPLMVSRGTRGELVFFGEYDPLYYLVAPVKALSGELWLASLFKDNKRRVEKKWVSSGRVLYKKTG